MACPCIDRVSTTGSHGSRRQPDRANPKAQIAPRTRGKKRHAPLARKMLSNNRNKALQAPKYRTMNNNRPRRRLLCTARTRARSSGGGLVGRAVLEVEAVRELKVELDRRALERALERVADRDVDLGPVERAVAGVQLPLARVLFVERVAQLLCVRASGRTGQG